MLMPKRVKHRKVQRGRRAGLAKGGTAVSAICVAGQLRPHSSTISDSHNRLFPVRQGCEVAVGAAQDMDGLDRWKIRPS